MSLLKYISLILCFIALNHDVFGQLNYQWAQQATKTTGNAIYSAHVATDLDKNSYVTGYYHSRTNEFIDFDGLSIDGFSSFAFQYDAYAAKYDKNGTIQWLRKLGSDREDRPRAIATDHEGNIIIVGDFSTAGSASGNANYFGQQIVSTGATDIFIAKIDPSGNLIWIETAGGTSTEWATSVDVDSSGNIYVAGRFEGVSNFNGSTITSNGTADFYVCKYDKNGTFQWVKSGGGAGGNDMIYDLTVGKQGIYVSGAFMVSTTIGTKILTTPTTGVQNGFIASYDLNGKYRWANAITGTDGETPVSIAVDTFENVFALFSSNSPTVNYEGSTITYSNVGADGSDVVLAKYQSTGNLVWVRGIGGIDDSNRAYAKDVMIDGGDKIYIAASFQGNINFQGINESGTNAQDALVVKYDTDGSYLCHKSTKGQGSQTPNRLATDGSNNIYLSGVLSVNSGPIDFDGTILTPNGSSMFLASIDMPYAGWNPDTICESSGLLDLIPLLKECADQNGTWSGTGVSGTQFDPSGLSGDIEVTYTVGTSTCDEHIEKHFIHVINEQLTAEIKGDFEMCTGDTFPDFTVELNQSNAPYYIYYAINGVQQPVIITNDTITLIKGSQNGSYTLDSVVATDMCPYIVKGTGTLINATPPTATISGNVTYCTGQPTGDLTIDLTGTGPWDVVYSIDGVSQTAMTINSSPYALSVNAPGIYHIQTVEDQNCEAIGLGSGTVIELNQLAPTIQGASIICQGDTAVLSTIQTYSSIKWTLNGSLFSNDPTIKATITGQYIVEVSSGAGCSGFDTLDLVVNSSSLSAVISGSYSYCGTTNLPNIDIQIDPANGPFAIYYSIDGVQQAPVLSTTNNYQLQSSGAGTYTLDSVVANSSCKINVSGSAQVSQNTQATATISGDATVCAGSTLPDVTIDFSQIGTYNIYYSIDGIQQPVINTTNNPYTFQATQQGIYTLDSVIDANCNATTSGSATITEQQNPIPGISGNVTYCEGKSAVLSASGGFQNYSWELNGNIVGTNSDLSISASGDYTITVVDANGCSGSETITATELEEIRVSDFRTICSATTGYIVQFQVSGGDPSSYNVTGIQGTLSNTFPYVFNSIALNDGDSYSISISDGNKCNTITLIGSYTCDDNPNPGCNVTAELFGDEEICANIQDSVPLTIELTGTPPFKFQITDGSLIESIENINATSYTYFAKRAGTYALIGVEDAVCSVGTVLGGGTVAEIECDKSACEFFTPNAFTPDGFGINELFYPVTETHCQFEVYDFYVFSRWGDLFFHTKSPLVGWNGKFKGSDVKNDTYVWKLVYRKVGDPDTQQQMGHVTVLR